MDATNMTNSTGIVADPYAPGAKVTLGLLGVVAVAMGWCTYVYVRRRLRHKESLKERAYLFYRAIHGVLIGNYMCHMLILMSLTDIKFAALFGLIAYMLLDGADLFGRAWNSTSGYVAPHDEDAVEDDFALNRKDMEAHPVVVVSGGNTTAFAQQVWRVVDADKEQRKRYWMLGVLFVAFAVITVMDGLLLVHRAPQTTGAMIAIVACFCTNGISMSTAVYGAMVHAKLHLIAGRQRRLLFWSAFSLLWCAMLLCSAIPVWSEMCSDTASAILRHWAFTAACGCAAACILWLHLYFHNKKLENADKRELFIGYIVSCLAAAQAATTAFWL